jgi:hypothetical protein
VLRTSSFLSRLNSPQRGVREHPELSVGSTTDGIEVRSVGNSPVLQETYLVEAFNLKVGAPTRDTKPCMHESTQKYDSVTVADDSNHSNKPIVCGAPGRAEGGWSSVWPDLT